MTEIIVAGYPKSGNSWLSRLLGDLYNCPVTGIDTAKPLCEEGLDRDSLHVVRQLHLKPTSIHDPDTPKQEWIAAVNNAWWFGIELWDRDTTKIIHIIRDPRDVAVSVQHYWNRPSLADAVEAMCLGQHPLRMHGTWQGFVEKWLDVDVLTVKYETLNIGTMGTLADLVYGLDIKPVNSVSDVVRRQSFRATRERIEKDGDSLNYGKTIQLHNLRKGIVGDWRNHFDKYIAQWANEYWGELLIDLGWERDPDWADKVKRGKLEKETL